MSVLSSLLVFACVCLCVSLVVATSEPNHDYDHVMIANHFTNAAAAAHSFRTLQSSSSSLKGISDACQTTTIALESNPNIQAAQRSVIVSGCTDGKKQSCSTDYRSCTCITYYSNDGPLRSLVASTQPGAQVCPLNFRFTAYTPNFNVDFHFQGIGGELQLIGSGCTNTDIQAMLSLGFDGFAQEISKTSSTKDIKSITGTISLCSTSYTGTRYTNGAENNNKPIGCAIALLIGAIITIINQAL